MGLLTKFGVARCCCETACGVCCNGDSPNSLDVDLSGFTDATSGAGVNCTDCDDLDGVYNLTSQLPGSPIVGCEVDDTYDCESDCCRYSFSDSTLIVCGFGGVDVGLAIEAFIKDDGAGNCLMDVYVQLTESTGNDSDIYHFQETTTGSWSCTSQTWTPTLNESIHCVSFGSEEPRICNAPTSVSVSDGG